jgi:Rha family phage regulatory protein
VKNIESADRFRPEIQVVQDRVMTTSLAVANAFEKNHRDVLRTIQALEVPDEFNQRNFALVDYKDAKGEMRPMYLMTRDGFTILAMGFTGGRAMEFKIRYIEAFNRMEEELRKPGRLSEGRNWTFEDGELEEERLRLEVERTRTDREWRFKKAIMDLRGILFGLDRGLLNLSDLRETLEAAVAILAEEGPVGKPPRGFTEVVMLPSTGGGLESFLLEKGIPPTDRNMARFLRIAIETRVRALEVGRVLSKEDLRERALMHFMEGQEG